MTQPGSDLRERLLALAEPTPIPFDLFDRVRSRARRRRIRQMGAAAAGFAAVAAVVAAIVAIPALFAGPRGPSAAQLSSLVAAGDAAVSTYHGPGIPADLRQTNLWLIEEGYSSPQHTVVVSYAKDGHPCLGEIDWKRQPDSKLIGSGFQGGCSFTGHLDALGSYGPLGSPQLVGTDAYFYGTVPREVRVVRADVQSGRLAERFVATIATPADSEDRFFLFHAPGGTERGLNVTLTFYDRNGTNVGSRHVNNKFDDNGDALCTGRSPAGTSCATTSMSSLLSGSDVALAPVQAVFPANDIAQAQAATRACPATDGFVFKVGSFGLHEEVLVTHPVPWSVAAAHAIGECLSRQPGVTRVEGGAMLSPPSACSTGLICPWDSTAARHS